jgi:hypothetical protein
MLESLLYVCALVAIAYIVLWGVKQDSKIDEESE